MCGVFRTSGQPSGQITISFEKNAAIYFFPPVHLPTF